MSTEHQSKTNLTNKEKAVSFLQLVASGKVRDAYQRHIGPGFCHHNPYFPGDARFINARDGGECRTKSS